LELLPDGGHVGVSGFVECFGGDGHPYSVLTGHGGNMDGVEVCSIVGAGVESVGRATDAMVKAGSSSLSCSSSSPVFFEIFVHPPAAADAGLVHGVAVDDYMGNLRWLEAAAPSKCVLQKNLLDLRR